MRHLLPLLILGSTLSGCGEKSCEEQGLVALNDQYFTVTIEQDGGDILVNWTPDAVADEVWVEDDQGAVLWHVRCTEELRPGACISSGVVMFEETPPDETEHAIETGSPDGDRTYTANVGQYAVECPDQQRLGQSGEFTLSSGLP